MNDSQVLLRVSGYHYLTYTRQLPQCISSWLCRSSCRKIVCTSCHFSQWPPRSTGRGLRAFLPSLQSQHRHLRSRGTARVGTEVRCIEQHSKFEETNTAHCWPQHSRSHAVWRMGKHTKLKSGNLDKGMKSWRLYRKRLKKKNQYNHNCMWHHYVNVLPQDMFFVDYSR